MPTDPARSRVRFRLPSLAHWQGSSLDPTKQVLDRSVNLSRLSQFAAKLTDAESVDRWLIPVLFHKATLLTVCDRWWSSDSIALTLASPHTYPALTAPALEYNVGTQQNQLQTGKTESWERPWGDGGQGRGGDEGAGRVELKAAARRDADCLSEGVLAISFGQAESESSGRRLTRLTIQ